MPFNVGGNILTSSQVKYFNDTNVVRSGNILYLDAGLRGSYPTTGTTWTDLSGNGYNGTLTNGPTFNSGSNGYIQFDGTNDFINLGSISELGFTSGVFTVEVWFYIPSSWTGGSQYPNLFSKGATAGWDSNGWSLFVFRDWSGPYAWGYGSRNGSTVNIVSRSSAPSNTYLHAVVTLDGSTIKLYENGLLYNSGTQTISPGSNSTGVLIGCDANPLYFQGRVAIVSAYNRALSATEVLQNFNSSRRRFNI
jgi:hypothetical protein